MEKKTNHRSLVISYLTLRKTLGWLGILFPFILYFGALVLFGTGLQRSVSSYYYTGMGDVFVGTICVIGFFLYSYRGYEPKDNITGDLACIFALGVAFFPAHATPDGTGLTGYIHLASSALFFATLIYFSLFLFTKSDPDRPPSPGKLRRNRIYRACGYIMALCILLITIYFLLPSSLTAAIAVLKPIFWLEAIAVVAFGISWLTKGGALIKD